MLWIFFLQNTAAFSDFNIRKSLGAGAFGRVVQALHIRTNVFYAIKILDKKKVCLS